MSHGKEKDRIRLFVEPGKGIPLAGRKDNEVSVMKNVQVVVGNGLFDWSEVLQTGYDWFSRHKYDTEVKQYKQTAKPTGLKLVAMHEGVRRPDRYSKYKLVIKYKAENTDPVVIKGSDRHFRGGGKFGVRIDATLVLDYDHTMDRTPFHRFLKAIYEKYFYKPRQKRHEKQLEIEAKSLLATMKSITFKYL